MFNLFRKKLKDVVEKFSKKVEEEAEEVVSEAEEKKDKPKKRFSIFRKKPKEEIKEEPAEEEGGAPEEAVEEEIKEESKESFEKKHEEESSIEREKPKKSFFEKIKGITRVKISEEKFEKLFEDLETVLLENNVAFDVIDKIKEDLKVDLVNVPIQNVRKAVRGSLINSLDGILSFTEIDLVKRAKQKKPYIILFVGVNGA